MLIVEVLAKDWGTSEDGTLTWCTIAVPEPSEVETALWVPLSHLASADAVGPFSAET